MSGKRIVYLDIVRIVCTLAIVYYHLTLEMGFRDIFPLDTMINISTLSTLNVCLIAVAIFFMMSGACLTISRKSEFDAKKYFISRFITVLIPFYFVDFVVRLASLYSLKFDFSAYLASYKSISPWKAIFTLLGSDSWFTSIFNVSTFSTGVGEWFLGNLVALYLLYPLFLFLLKKNPNLFLSVSTCLYIVILYHYNSATIPSHLSILLNWYEFALGMYLGYCGTYIDKQWAKIIVPITVFLLVGPSLHALNYRLVITLSALAVILSISFLEDFLQKKNTRWISVISNYTFVLFLVHHILMSIMLNMFMPHMTTLKSKVLYIAIILVTLLVVTVVFKLIIDLIQKCLKSVFKLKKGA